MCCDNIYPMNRSHVFVVKTRKEPFINYSYIIFQRDHCVIIDPAWEEEKYLQILTATESRVSAILLTHSHQDHCDLANEFADRFKCSVFASRSEIEFYQYDCINLRSFEEGDHLVIEEISIETIPTPGHTKGSVCYLIENRLFTGDTLFNEGCGLCRGMGASPYEMHDSLTLLKNKIANDTIIYPGHSFGSPVGLTFGELCRNNIYLNFRNQSSFVSFRMRQNQSSQFNFK